MRAVDAVAHADAQPVCGELRESAGSFPACRRTRSPGHERSHTTGGFEVGYDCRRQA